MGQSSERPGKIQSEKVLAKSPQWLFPLQYQQDDKFALRHSKETKEIQKGEKENNGKPIYLPVYKFSLDDCQDLQLYWIP
jgi:hypothetical protein